MYMVVNYECYSISKEVFALYNQVTRQYKPVYNHYPTTHTVCISINIIMYVYVPFHEICLFWLIYYPITRSILRTLTNTGDNPSKEVFLFIPNLSRVKYKPLCLCSKYSFRNPVHQSIQIRKLKYAYTYSKRVTLKCLL